MSQIVISRLIPRVRLELVEEPATMLVMTINEMVSKLYPITEYSTAIRRDGNYLHIEMKAGEED